MDPVHCSEFSSATIVNNHLTFRRSRFLASCLYSCSSGIANPEVNLIRSSKWLLMDWWPYSWSRYTLPEWPSLLLMTFPDGLTPGTIDLLSVFRRSTPTSHVSSSGKSVPQLNITCPFKYTNPASPLYLRCFAQGYLHRCIKPMLKASCVNYTLCPACDQSVDATMTPSQDIPVAPAEQERSSASTDTFRCLYTEDVESQPLLPESPLVDEGKQTTGIVTNNWTFNWELRSCGRFGMAKFEMRWCDTSLFREPWLDCRRAAKLRLSTI